MHNVKNLLILVLGLLLTLPACGGDAGTNDPGAVCEAGKSEQCACSSGDVGAQVCKSDGSAWGECTCGAASAGASSGGSGGSVGTARGGGGGTGGASVTGHEHCLQLVDGQDPTCMVKGMGTFQGMCTAPCIQDGAYWCCSY
jgi:hypothetical protein